MLRWLAAEGESYRGDCAPGSVTGSTACRIEARCFTKGQWSETLPACRLRGCQRAATLRRGAGGTSNHHQRRSALLYPRKTACNGSRAASCAPHQAKEKAPLGSRLPARCLSIKSDP